MVQVADRQGIILKSDREIELMRSAGRLVRKVHETIRDMVKPGVSTAELNAAAEALILNEGGEPLFKGVVNPHAKFAFPAALCTSVNDQLVHGIPNDRSLQEGDILSVDCGVRLAGYCGDAALTHAVGSIDADSQRLLDVTQRSLEVAIENIRPGRMWSEVAKAIQETVEHERFAVVRDFVGHGIGQEMHEDPKVPNCWGAMQKGMDFKLVSGMVLAIEPMVCIGTHRVRYGDADGWVVVTRDGKHCAHFEHTVAVRDHGADILTDGR